MCFLRHYGNPESCPANHAAGDLCSGIAGRLRMKIVGHTVNDNGSSDDVCHAETVCYHGLASTAAARQQWGQIPCVGRVGRICRIVVIAGVRKVGSGAAASFMDMKAKEAGIAVRKTFDLGGYQDAILLLEKLDLAAQVGGAIAAVDHGDGVGTGEIHNNTSY